MMTAEFQPELFNFNLALNMIETAEEKADSLQLFIFDNVGCNDKTGTKLRGRGGAYVSGHGGYEGMARQWELARVWCAALLVSCPRVTRVVIHRRSTTRASLMLLFCRSHSYIATYLILVSSKKDKYEVYIATE